MPKYKVLEKSNINNEMHEPGAIIDYDGLPAENLEPQCDEGKAKYQEYLDSNAARVKLLKDQNSKSKVGDPAEFAKALAEHQASQNEGIAKAISEGIAAGIAQAMAAMQPKPAQDGSVPSVKGANKKDSLV